LYNSESPLSKYDLCQLWWKLALQFWRSQKHKSLTDRQTTDNGQSEKLTWALSSGELIYHTFYIGDSFLL
jgi:hypothetical protein